MLAKLACRSRSPKASGTASITTSSFRRKFTSKPPLPPASKGIFANWQARLHEHANEIRRQQADPNGKKGILDEYNKKLKTTSDEKMQGKSQEERDKKERIRKHIDHFLDDDRNKAERHKLMEKAFVRGYFDDAKEVARKGDKLWIASDKMIQEHHAQGLFALETRNLTGDTVQLVGLCKSKSVSLVSFAFNAFGEPHCKSFVEQFERAFGGRSEAQVVQVMVEETWTKVPILKMMVPFIRKRISVEQHENYLLSYENIEDLRRPVGIVNKLLGWVVLVDGAGRIRWVAHGHATAKELENMMKFSETLIKDSSSNY